MRMRCHEAVLMVDGMGRRSLACASCAWVSFFANRADMICFFSSEETVSSATPMTNLR